MVWECTGVFLTRAALQPYFDKGVKKVVVSAPVKDPDAVLNVVMGCNDVRHSGDVSVRELQWCSASHAGSIQTPATLRAALIVDVRWLTAEQTAHVLCIPFGPNAVADAAR